MKSSKTTMLVSLLMLTACGQANDSALNASVSQSLEQKWSNDFDLSRELSPSLADNLTATRSRHDTIEIGKKSPPTFKIGRITLFKTGPSVEFKDLFERKIMNQVIIGRERDADGSGDGNGVFLDNETIAANRYVKCVSQKVISEGSSFQQVETSGTSFLGFGLEKEKTTGQRLAASTDYVMQRGSYKTKKPLKLAQLLELCGDIAKSDVGLQQLESINEVIKLNFQNEAEVEKWANEVAQGKKVNNFKFHNAKFDFKILRRENGAIVFEIFPDTHYSDPKLEARVSYHMEGALAVMDEVKQSCVSNCQNYHDAESKHGLKSYGAHLTKAQNEGYVKLLSLIFAAKALGSH